MFAQYFSNKRIFAILLMGFSSGLPLTLTSSTLQAWFTQSGVDLVTIGALSLIGIPYTFKFLWSPFLDRFSPPFLDRRRGWMLITQFGLAATLFVVTCFNPTTTPKLIGFIALFIAFLSASQDIAYDAYRTDIALPAERGLAAAALTMGYRIAMLVSGGLALILADHIGWIATYRIMAILMFLLGCMTICAPQVAENHVPQTFVKAVIEPFKNLLKRECIFFILIFIVLYKIGDALALSLMTNFLLHTLTFSLTEIGLIFKTGGMIATITGAIVGGIIMVRTNIYKALLWFGLLQACSNLLFMLLAIAGKNYVLMVTAIVVEQFCSGMSTAALVAFLMSLCDHRYTATQYALLSALASIGRVFLGPLAAMMVKDLGWVNFYGWATLACFPGLILLLFLYKRVQINAEAIA